MHKPEKKLNSLVLAPFDFEGLQALSKIGSVTYEPWTESQLIHEPEQLGIRITKEGYNVLIVEADFLVEELFENAKPLTFAAVCRNGLNHVELDAATKHGVTIVHTPGRNAQAVAELVIGSIFSLIRNIHSSNTYIKGGNWGVPTEPYVKFRGREISNMRLGIVGLGNIGSTVGALATKLGMKVLGYDPYVVHKIKDFDYVHLGSLNALLESCDILTLHLVENSETNNLIGLSELLLLGPTGYLINTSSHAVVNNDDLIEALKSNIIAGAALDVHMSHPIPPNSTIINLENALVTPHIGGATLETITRHSNMVLEDLSSYIEGSMPKRIANPKVWATRRPK